MQSIPYGTCDDIFRRIRDKLCCRPGKVRQEFQEE